MSEQKSELLQVRVEPSLVERVDAVRGDASRSLFVRRAVETALAVREGSSRVPAGVPRALVERPFGREVGDPEKLEVERLIPSRSPRVDAENSYVRMMAERQARMNEGKKS